MNDQRVPFGAMVKALQDFNDYRISSNKASYSYKKGDIVPVDSTLIYVVSSLVKNGLFEILENQQWEGFEEDYSIDKNEYIQYPIFKIRFKNPNRFVKLPSLNKEGTYKVQENVIINDGQHAFRFMYSDGSEFPDFEVAPGTAYRAIYLDDESDKGRWTFSSYTYYQDSSLETSPGSIQTESQKLNETFLVSEDLDQFDFVYVFLNNQSALSIKKAFAGNDQDKAFASGFVKSSYTTGQSADVYTSGLIDFSNQTLIPNKTYYLSILDKGKISDSIVSSPGQVFQRLGISWSSTKFNVLIESPFELA